MVLRKITNKGAITMDHIHSNTIEGVRTPGRHLSLEERGMIQALHRQGLSLRDIAAAVGCAHTQPFSMSFGVERWSLDACVGYARRNKLFTLEQISCTKTLYNMLWANKLPISLFEVPRALGHKRHRIWVRKNKRIKGRSIEERPAIVNDGTEIGHWEVDTVVGQRAGREAVVFTAVEKVTRNYIAIRIPGRTCAGIEAALAQLQDLYGTERFSQIFKTMTADNGPEFETLSQFERLGTKMYFTHPYSSWERAQNECHNGLLRDFIPKGMAIERFSDEDILNMADALNQRPAVFWATIRRQSCLMHSSMKFMLLSVFLDYGCLNSTCNLPKKLIHFHTLLYHGLSYLLKVEVPYSYRKY